MANLVPIPQDDFAGDRPDPPYVLNIDSDQARGLSLWFPLDPERVSAELRANLDQTITQFATSQPLWIQGHNLCPLFNNDPDYAEYPDSPYMDVPQVTTVAFWIRLNSVDTLTQNYLQNIWSDENVVDLNGLTAVWRVGSGGLEANKAKIGINFNDGAGHDTESTSNLTVGAETHIAITTDGTNAKFYFNGVLDRTVAYSITPTQKARVWRIGRATNALDVTARPLRAYLWDLSIYYGTAKTAEQIEAMYDPRSRWEKYLPLGRRAYSFTTSAPATQTALSGTASVEVDAIDAATAGAGTTTVTPGTATIEVSAIAAAATGQGTATATVDGAAVIQVSAHDVTATAVGTATATPGVATIQVSAHDVGTTQSGTVTVVPGVAVIEVDGIDATATATTVTVALGVAIIEVDATDDVTAIGQGTATVVPGVAIIEVSAIDVESSSPPDLGGGGKGASSGRLLEGFVTRVSQVYCDCICPGPEPCTECDEICEIQVLLALRKPYADIGPPNAPRYINYVAVSPWISIWEEYVVEPISPIDPLPSTGWTLAKPNNRVLNWSDSGDVPRPVSQHADPLPLEHYDFDPESWLPMAAKGEDDE